MRNWPIARTTQRRLPSQKSPAEVSSFWLRSTLRTSVKREPPGGQLFRIDDHLQLVFQSAEHGRLRHARHALEAGFDLVLGEAAHLRDVEVSGGGSSSLTSGCCLRQLAEPQHADAHVVRTCSRECSSSARCRVCLAAKASISSGVAYFGLKNEPGDESVRRRPTC